MKGLREQIKAGEISPYEAIKSISPGASPYFVSWARGAGKRRYEEALVSKARVEAEAKAKSDKEEAEAEEKAVKKDKAAKKEKDKAVKKDKKGKSKKGKK